VFIVAHGWSSSRYQVLGRAALLARFASRIVVYDLRGHGDSSARSTRMGTLEAQDLIAVIDQTPTDGRPIVLFGPSMGAGIAIAAAADDQTGKVAGVIAESTYRHLVEPIAAHLRSRRLPTQPFSALAALYVEVVLGSLRPFDRAHYAARLRCPLLVIHGSEDIVCAQAPARRIADAAPQGRFVLIQGAGHSNPAEVDETRYFDAIETFINEIAERVSDQSAPAQPQHDGHAAQQGLSI
jgi:pimeloyl-ACP methyl ester carboxylesterase